MALGISDERKRQGAVRLLDPEPVLSLKDKADIYSRISDHRDYACACKVSESIPAPF